MEGGSAPVFATTLGKFTAYTLVFIFLTGCSTTKWEWLPKDKASYEIKSGNWEEEPRAIDVVRISF